MSEQIRHNPEQELPKWYDNCSRCETKYELNPDNTIYIHFEKKTECNYLVCKCPKCSYVCMIFDEAISPNDALARNIDVDDSDRDPNEKVYAMWLEVRGIELPKTYDLTPRMEKVIAHFGDTLRKMPDDLLMDGFTDPNKGDTPYPFRWA